MKKHYFLQNQANKFAFYVVWGVNMGINRFIFTLKLYLNRDRHLRIKNDFLGQ